MPTQVIQLHRRVTGVGVPTTLAEGEPFYNSLGQELYIGDASGTPQTLVSESRQVGVTTDTVITGNKTIDVTLLHVVGGTAGQVLSTVDGAGDMAFITPAAAGSGDAAVSWSHRRWPMAATTFSRRWKDWKTPTLR